CREMLFNPGKIADIRVRLNLEMVCAADIDGTAFANCKLERTVSKRCGGLEVAGDDIGTSSQDHQIDQLLEAAASFGKRRATLDCVDSFGRRISGGEHQCQSD